MNSEISVSTVASSLLTTAGVAEEHTDISIIQEWEIAVDTESDPELVRTKTAEACQPGCDVILVQGDRRALGMNEIKLKILRTLAVDAPSVTTQLPFTNLSIDGVISTVTTNLQGVAARMVVLQEGGPAEASKETSIAKTLKSDVIVNRLATDLDISVNELTVEVFTPIFPPFPPPAIPPFPPFNPPPTNCRTADCVVTKNYNFDDHNLNNGCCCTSGGQCASYLCDYFGAWTCTDMISEPSPSPMPSSSPELSSDTDFCDLNLYTDVSNPKNFAMSFFVMGSTQPGRPWARGR